MKLQSKNSEVTLFTDAKTGKEQVSRRDLHFFLRAAVALLADSKIFLFAPFSSSVGNTPNPGHA